MKNILPKTGDSVDQEINTRSERVQKNLIFFAGNVRDEFDRFWSRPLAKIQEEMDRLGDQALALFNEMEEVREFINKRLGDFIPKEIPYGVDEKSLKKNKVVLFELDDGEEA